MTDLKGTVCFALSCLGLSLALGLFSGPVAAVPRSDEVLPAIDELRIAFTKEVLGGHNESDAVAAIEVWISKIIQNWQIRISPVINVYKGTAGFQSATRAENSDLFGVRVDDYLRSEALFKPDQLFAVVKSGEIEVEYLLLTRIDGPVSRLEDLRDRSIISLDAAGSILASAWLDTALMRQGLPPAEEMFKHVERSSKISQTLLPVFFGRADACVVTREGFETMNELNPQVGLALQPIAVSPPLVPAVICFRAGYDWKMTDDLVEGLLGLHEDPQGQQVLLMFRSDSVRRIVPGELDSARQLIMEHQQLRSERTRESGQGSE